jgi:hypothetical protein
VILAARLRQLPLSLALLGLFAVVGWSVLPSRAATQAGAWRLRDPVADTSGIGVPVFALRQDGIAVLFGEANRTADGVIHLALYNRLDPILADTTQAVSLPGDLRLLWLLASEGERQRLREMASRLAIGLSDTAFAVLQAPEFAAEYRPRLLDIAQSALLAAWEDARAQAAWEQLLQACEPLLREVVTRELRPIVASRFEGVAARLLSANAGRLIPLIGGGNWDLEAVEQAVQASIAEAREEAIPQHALLRFLALHEARQFLQVFLAVAGDRLVHNPALIDLLARVVTDTRFRPALVFAATPAAVLGRAAPRLMVSLHGSTDLNLVASFVIHTMAAGRTDRVIVLMSAAQYREIAAIDPGVARPLELAR